MSNPQANAQEIRAHIAPAEQYVRAQPKPTHKDMDALFKVKDTTIKVLTQENNKLTITVNKITIKHERAIKRINTLKSQKRELADVLRDHKRASNDMMDDLEKQANNAMHQAAKISSDVRKKVRIKHAKKKNIANQYQTLAGNVLANSHALYKKLNEHHEFERRLLDMITQREQQRNKAKNSDTSLLSQEVLALHQRLGRCRQAISVIERDIEFVEKR